MRAALESPGRYKDIFGVSMGRKAGNSREIRIRFRCPLSGNTDDCSKGDGATAAPVSERYVALYMEWSLLPGGPSSRRPESLRCQAANAVASALLLQTKKRELNNAAPSVSLGIGGHGLDHGVSYDSHSLHIGCHDHSNGGGYVLSTGGGRGQLFGSNGLSAGGGHVLSTGNGHGQLLLGHSHSADSNHSLSAGDMSPLLSINLNGLPQVLKEYVKERLKIRKQVDHGTRGSKEDANQ